MDQCLLTYIIKSSPMDEYKQLLSLVTENFFENENKELIQLGRKLMDFLLFNTAVASKDIKQYHRLKDETASLISQKLDIFLQKTHVEMCFGELAKSRDYQRIGIVEREFEKMTKSKGKENSFVNPYKEQMMMTLDETMGKLEKSESSFLDLIEEKSAYKEEEEKKVRISEVERLFKKLNMSEICESSDSVEEYLSTIINPKSELNLLVQKFKFMESEWDRGEFVGGRVSVEKTITISNYYSEGKERKFKVQEVDTNTKKAQERAARALLQKIYQALPKVMEEIIKIKKMESIPT